MKTLVATAATVALLALAGPVSAQMYRPMPPQPGPSRSWDPDAAGSGGPQWRWMVSHGYTIDDAMSPGMSQAYSSGLNRRSLSRANTTIVETAPGPGPYAGPRFPYAGPQ